MKASLGLQYVYNREPQVNFEEWLEQTVEWYLENQGWVEEVITGEYQEYYEKVYGRE